MELGGPFRQLLKTMNEFANPKTGDCWLDAGCGPAHMSKILWEKSGKSLNKIVAMDICPAVAREKLDTIPSLDLRYGNLGEPLKFDDCSFDGIICNVVLAYVIEFNGTKGKDGVIKVFEEFLRVLKPGGQFVWSVTKPNMNSVLVGVLSIPDIIKNAKNIPDLPGKAISLVRYGRKLKEKADNGLYTMLDQNEWSALLETVGFINQKWKETHAGQIWVNKCYKKQ